MTLSPAARRSVLASAAALAAIAIILMLRNAVVPEPLERLQRTGDVYEGSWHFPRGGPYMVGYESPGPARLYLDGVLIQPRGDRPVVREPWRGAVRADAPRGTRLAFDPGVVGVRFEAPPGARLLWIPPGRRSDPEYVPPSSLAPEPPERAQFGAWAGARPDDGLFAVSLALVILVWLAYLLRGWFRRTDRKVLIGAAAVLGFALGVRLIDLGGAGQTWDENTNWSAGRNYITNLLSLDFSQASWGWNYEHPPVMKYLAGLGAQWSDGYGPARGLSALVMAMTCALLVPIGRRLFSLRVGLLAGAIAALTPHLIAHGKIVGHEAASALWWTLAVLLCLRAYDDLAAPEDPAARRRLLLRFAGIGVVLGLAVFSRFANLLLAPLIGAVLVTVAPPRWRARTVGYGFAVLPVVAVAVGFALWPRLWSNPLEHLGESWDKLKRPHGAEPFLGSITNTPPRYYFAAYLGATAPLGVLLGAAAWLVRVGVRRERGSLIVALWLLVPMAILLSPVRQDGVRYIMPAVVALALTAAAGFDFAVSRLRVRRAFEISAAVVVLYLGVTAARIHPYYLDYYGEHTGGPARVAQHQSFEIAWWGEGLEAAVEYLNQHAAPGDRVYKGCISPYDHLGWLRGDLWRTLATSASSSDWILVYQSSNSSRDPACRPSSPFSSLSFSVRAQGAPMATVYRRAASPASPSRSPAPAPPPR